MRLRHSTNPSKHGPFHYRSPARIFWRTVRGMIPHKSYRGKQAMARMQVRAATPRIPPPLLFLHGRWAASRGRRPTCGGSPRVDSTGAQVGGRTDVRMGLDGRTDGRTDGQTDGRTARGATGRTVGWAAGRADREDREIGTDGRWGAGCLDCNRGQKSSVARAGMRPTMRRTNDLAPNLNTKLNTKLETIQRMPGINMFALAPSPTPPTLHQLPTLFTNHASPSTARPSRVCRSRSTRRSAWLCRTPLRSST